MISRINFITSSAVIAALCTTACGDGSTSPTQAVPPSIPRFSGGSSGGGGGGTPAPSPTSVVGYSNLGASDSVSTFIGWGLIGLLQTPAGFFADVAERFAPTTSGTIASIRLAVQQTGTGGNGGYSVLVYADNSSAPDSTSCSTGACQGTTLGTLIGTFQGRTIRQVFGATTAGLSTIAVSNGPRLQAGPNFWIKVVPSSQTRLTWCLNTRAVVGEQFYEDPYTPQLSSMDAGGSQGAFEVRVNP